MQGVPIKFRGKTISDGRLVYGDYVSFNDRCAICVEVKNLISFRYLHPYIFDVDPNSVAQLVGYDADGNEVYEGDKLYYYRCFCLSGSTIRENKMKPAGVCTVISADRLEGLYKVGLNDHCDYEFLLKSTIDNEKKARCKNDC